MNRLAISLVAATVYGVLAPAAGAAPKATLAPKTWELDFQFHDPQRITLTLPGDRQPSTFWYMLFTVSNNTRREVEFYPTFRLVTDTMEVVNGGAAISPSVYDAVFDRHRGRYPFITLPSKITGPLLQGEDNGRTSVAIFRMFDKLANRFTLYISGLSGDLERMPNPGFDAGSDVSDENPRSFILRRTLAVEYALPGDSQTRFFAIPIRRNRSWVMR